MRKQKNECAKWLANKFTKRTGVLFCKIACRFFF